MQESRRYWFRAKRYGWGWTPSCWQGWAAIGVWAVIFTALVIGASAAATSSQMTLFGLLIALSMVSTLVLVWVSWRHGEPPRWRWGD